MRGSSQTSRGVYGSVAVPCIGAVYCKVAVREEGGTSEVDAVGSKLSNAYRRSSRLLKFPLGLTLPAENFSTPLPRRSADDAQLYRRLCVCSGSLLARS